MTLIGFGKAVQAVHSFRSGFYCQSILNSQQKSLDINTMKELSQLLAGWKTKSDAAVCFKIEMDEQIQIKVTNKGFLTNPTVEKFK